MAPARSSSRGEGHSGSGSEIWRDRRASEAAKEQQKDRRILVWGAEILWHSPNPFLPKNTDALSFKGVLLKSVLMLVFIPYIIVNKNLVIKK